MNRLRVVIAMVLVGGATLAWGQGQSLTLVAQPNPSTFGQNVNLTATLTGYNSGSHVIFYDGVVSTSNEIGRVAVPAGTGGNRVVQLNKANFTAGTHNLSATCCVNSDGTFSGTRTLTVNKATPTVTFSADPTTATFGQSVSLSANVSGNVTGTVTFLNNGNQVGQSQSLFGSAANMNFPFLPGTYSLTARYNGDGNNNSVTSSPPVTLTVNKAPTTTVLSSNINPSAAGQTITLTALVQPNGPGGPVNFMDGQTSLGLVALNNPSITLSTSSLSSGTHSLTAVYAGDANYAGSTSNIVSQTVGSSGPKSITSISPTTGAAGGAQFTLTINGTGFVQGASAQWNGTALATSLVNSSQVTATVPASLLASAGTALIKVVTGGGTTNSAKFVVNPAGQLCNFTFAPLAATFGSGGGQGSSTVTASRNDCTWTPTSNVSFITFPGGSTTGSGTFTYNVGANPGANSRSGKITVGLQSFIVTQGGTRCTFTLPGGSQSFPGSGGAGVVFVQAPAGCSWTADEGGSAFVAIAPPRGGSGNGKIQYTVAANSTSGARSATLTVAGRPFTVVQSASGSNLSCTVSAASVPQVFLEGLTEAAGGVSIRCAGLTSTIKADITLTLNTNVTNPLNGSINALLSVNGSTPSNGVVTGYNAIRFPGILLSPNGSGAVNVDITQVCANGNLAPGPGSGQAAPITGLVSIGALTVVPLIAPQQTIANAATSLIFSKSQAIPPAGGARTIVPLVFQEADPFSFQANGTRMRAVVTNLPGNVQVFAPIGPAEGASRAQLYSADPNGAGGAPVNGSQIPEGLYQQLTVNGGTATATWLALAADGGQTETWTYNLVLVNASTNDLNQIQVAGSLGPVSDVNVASFTAPVPRYRDTSVAQKLVNLRLTTTTAVQSSGALGPLLRSREAVLSHPKAVDVGSKVTFSHQLVNDTSDPTQTATNVVIRDNLPSGLSLISCTAPGATCGGSGNEVQVNAGSIAPGQTVTVTVVAQVDPSLAGGTLLENPVSASSDQINEDVMAATASSSFIVLNGVPVAVGHTPAFGSGSQRDFTFQFSHPSGFQNLGVINILINNFLDGRNACYLAYVVTGNNLLLVDDGGHAGGPFAGSVVLGDSAPIQNSQCSVILTGALGNGSTLTINLNITFKPAFGGNRIVFVAARDQAQANTDWQALGVWQVPFNSPGAITVAGVNPARSSGPAGTNKQFTFTFTSNSGTGVFGVMNVLTNIFLDGRKACYIAYVASSNTLILVDDQGNAGGPFAGSMVLNGTSASVENSQCHINSSGSAVSFAAGTLNLTLNITFKPAFVGNRVFYVAGRDAGGGNNTDWQSMGTHSVQ